MRLLFAIYVIMSDPDQVVTARNQMTALKQSSDINLGVIVVTSVEIAWL